MGGRSSSKMAAGRRPSVLLHGVQDAQQVDEEVDDVQVQVDGGQDVLLRGQLVHQKVCVVDDEPAEDQRSGAGEEQLCRLVVEEHLRGENPIIPIVRNFVASNTRRMPYILR